MIGRLLRKLPRRALLRVVRARQNEWQDGRGDSRMIVDLSGRRDIVGWIDDWYWSDDFDLIRGEHNLTSGEAGYVWRRWQNLVRRVGLERAVSLVQKSAKAALGNGH